MRRTPRTSVLTRVLTVLSMLAALVGGAAIVASPASANTTLCTGNSYSTCTNAGYTDHGFGAHNSTSYWGAYAGHNCTNYVAYVESTVNGASSPGNNLGYAYQWASSAKAKNIPVNGTPVKGSVAQWNANAGGASSYGHVAYVESVNSDGSITVSEDSADSGPFDWRLISKGSSSWPSNFIHFKDITDTGASTGGAPPDTDGDGVPDSSDQCPMLPGPSYPNGCTPAFTRMTGDFNGDGKADVANFYRYDGGALTLFVWPSNGDGTFGSPIWGWHTESGWDGNRVIPAGAGDFNGDGKADVAAFFRYDNGELALFFWPGHGDGTFGSPIWGWHTASGFDGARLLTAGVGDFNGDGKLDVSTFFRYDDNSVELFVFPGQGDGTFGAPVWGIHATGWDGLRVIPSGVGDFNGDGKLDVSTFFRYDNGELALFVYPGNGDGTFGTPYWGWHASSGWDGFRVNPIGVGDFNGDGKSDVAVVFRYDDGSIELFDFTSTGSGTNTFNAPIWASYQTEWDGFRVRT